ncbi:MAG: cobalt ECF transporter T component CbiQ [Candidatus Methanoperedens sp.]|nr:cobalt ECF transporter T component CbiQ [Candidatus Methanoperedens sp.]
MPEWLTRDPLNGLVVTFAFFISLIAGRYLREKRLQAEDKGRKTDPRIKLMVSFLLIIAVTSMEHWYFPVIISISCMAAAMRLRMLRDYSKKLAFPLLLASFILVIQGFTYGVTRIPGIIPLYIEGVEYGFLIFTRIFASASILVLLITTILENELLESMRWFRVPDTVIDISSFMVRYIKTFSNEGRKIKLAQESRCGFSGDFTNRMNNAASLCGALITRAFGRSDMVYRAMLSRGWQPRSLRSRVTPMSRSDAVLGLVLSTGIIGLSVFDRFL